MVSLQQSSPFTIILTCILLNHLKCSYLTFNIQLLVAFTVISNILNSHVPRTITRYRFWIRHSIHSIWTSVPFVLDFCMNFVCSSIQFFFFWQLSSNRRRLEVILAIWFWVIVFLLSFLFRFLSLFTQGFHQVNSIQIQIVKIALHVQFLWSNSHCCYHMIPFSMFKLAINLRVHFHIGFRCSGLIWEFIVRNSLKHRHVMLRMKYLVAFDKIRICRARKM